MTGITIVLAIGAFVAIVNGANDVSKGIATLVGGGVTDYRRAVLWGTAWTGVGGLAAVVWGGAMAETFGNGLLASGTTATFPAAVATIAGAALWVLIATRRGLPVSTTHAIVGSLTGVAAVAYGIDGVRWGAVGGKVLVPLLLSPVVSFVAVMAVQRGARAIGWHTASADCLCAAMEPTPALAPSRGGSMPSTHFFATRARLRFFEGTVEGCADAGPGILRLGVDRLHWLTSGMTSLARGMNDAPKMAALTIAAAALGGGARIPSYAMLGLVTLGMVAGGLVAGKRVTRVLAEDVTTLDHREGFVANVVTAALVLGGAVGGLPMSTTHVAASAVMGTGMHRAPTSLNRSVVAQMLLAWVVTLPAGAALGILSYVAMAHL